MVMVNFPALHASALDGSRLDPTQDLMCNVHCRLQAQHTAIPQLRISGLPFLEMFHASDALPWETLLVPSRVANCVLLWAPHMLHACHR